MGVMARLTLGVGIALAAASLAFAQAVSPAVALTFLDANSDGKVDLNDYLNRQLPKLAANDADQDGMLNYQEFKASLEGKAKQNAESSFSAFDSESVSRKLTQREFLGYHAFVFNTILDTNHDGVLSEKELSRIMPKTK